MGWSYVRIRSLRGGHVADRIFRIFSGVSQQKSEAGVKPELDLSLYFTWVWQSAHIFTRASQGPREDTHTHCTQTHAIASRRADRQTNRVTWPRSWRYQYVAQFWLETHKAEGRKVAVSFQGSQISMNTDSRTVVMQLSRTMLFGGHRQVIEPGTATTVFLA